MFFLWSVAQAWDWLIHVPVLGFLGLLLLGLIVIAICGSIRDQ